MDTSHRLLGARAVTADGYAGVVVRTSRHGRVVHVHLDTGQLVRTRVERLWTLAPLGAPPAA